VKNYPPWYWAFALTVVAMCITVIVVAGMETLAVLAVCGTVALVVLKK